MQAKSFLIDLYVYYSSTELDNIKSNSSTRNETFKTSKKSYQDSVNNELTAIWATPISGECEPLKTIGGGTGEQAFFEQYKKKSKKAKKGVKIEAKKEGDKHMKQLKFLVGKKD